MRRRRISPTIELIPLIDTMFLLLVFFVYAAVSLTTTRQLPVELPQVMKAVRIDKDYQQIVIKKDSLFLNEKKISITGLKNVSPGKKVYIAADKNVAYGRVAQILSILRANNISRISLETK